jgi:hypothetical protein
MQATGNKKITFCLSVIFLFFSINSCGPGSPKLSSKKYPEGFSLKHPENWQAQIVDKAYIWISAKEGEKDPSFILVYPFFLKNTMRSGSWLEQNLPNLPKFFNNVAFEKTQQTRTLPDESIAKFDFKRDKAAFRGLAFCSIYERSGILYVLASPQQEFEKRRNELLSMLESFKFEEPAAGAEVAPRRPRIQYVPWQDAMEQAFSTEVPQGWSVQGGTYRRASVDLVHVVNAVSPDQKIRIQFNDNNLPIFAIPNQTMAWAGFTEGSWYSPGYGVRMLIKRYTPGGYFLNEYLQQNYIRNLAKFEFVSQKDRPDIVANFNRIYSQYQSYGISFTLHGGDAAFRFEQNSEPYIGYGLALTQVVQSMAMQGGNWSVALLLIYTCPETEAETVREIADHMFKNVRMNPQWVASQQQLTANVSQIVTQTNQEISKIIDDSYWTRQGAMDNINRKFSNYILGVTDVVDPATGETYKVEAGHNYYWHKDYTNVVVGTEVYTRPDIDFSPLKEF